MNYQIHSMHYAVGKDGALNFSHSKNEGFVRPDHKNRDAILFALMEKGLTIDPNSAIKTWGASGHISVVGVENGQNRHYYELAERPEKYQGSPGGSGNPALHS